MIEKKWCGKVMDVTSNFDDLGSGGLVETFKVGAAKPLLAFGREKAMGVEIDDNVMFRAVNDIPHSQGGRHHFLKHNIDGFHIIKIFRIPATFVVINDKCDVSAINYIFPLSILVQFRFQFASDKINRPWHRLTPVKNIVQFPVCIIVNRCVLLSVCTSPTVSQPWPMLFYYCLRKERFFCYIGKTHHKVR